VIFGDSTVQHFGIEFSSFYPARVYVKCDKIAQVLDDKTDGFFRND